jgi:hypothetical protein
MVLFLQVLAGCDRPLVRFSATAPPSSMVEICYSIIQRAVALVFGG